MKNERTLVKETKPQNTKTTTPRSFLFAAAVAGIILLSLTMSSFGQKEQAERATTRDALAVTGLMTNPEVSDDLEGTEDEYFYKFQAVPGKLTLTVDVNANQTNAGAMLDLFGVNEQPILSNLLVQAANAGSERVSRSVNIAKKQEIVIRIKGLRYGSSAGYPGTYKIVLEGAVSFNVAAPSELPVQNNIPAPSDVPVQANTPVPSDAPVQVNTPVASDTPVQNSTSAPTDTPAASVTTGQNKKPSKTERVIEKTKSKSEKLLRVLDIVTEKKPN